jgi:hypothetical protein
LGFEIYGLGLGFRARIEGSGLGFRARIEGSGSGFRVWGLGARVEGWGRRCLPAARQESLVRMQSGKGVVYL